MKYSMSLFERKWTITFIIILVPLGIYTKFYHGLASSWVNDSLGGILYIIFWSLVLFLFCPNLSPVKITVLIFLITCAIEFLQLWHPEFLEIIRNNFFGQALLGTSFSWLDLFHYLLGSLVALILIKQLHRVEARIQ